MASSAIRPGDSFSHQWSRPMKAALLTTTALPADLIGLAHVPRELIELIEPGQDVPSYRILYGKVTNGDLPMAKYVRGRWYFGRPDMPAVAQALGLRLKPSGRRSAARRSAA
jgi:hypothetical protein